MVQATRRTAFSGPTLIRLLARLTDLDVPASGQPLSDRLSLWLSWRDAIALSSVLEGKPAAMSPAARAEDGSAEAAEYERVRVALAAAIANERPFGASPRRAGAGRQAGGARINPQPAPHSPSQDEAVEYGPYRDRYVSLQGTMQRSIGKLRSRLRTALAGRAPEMSRLAMVDAVMEQALGAREQTLLATVPTLLARHFERLRQAAQATPAAGPWLDTFRGDMRSVLLAELDIRLQPVQGLLAALRAS